MKAAALARVQQEARALGLELPAEAALPKVEVRDARTLAALSKLLRARRHGFEVVLRRGLAAA